MVFPQIMINSKNTVLMPIRYPDEMAYQTQVVSSSLVHHFLIQ